jgi:TolA-binding protein
MVMVGLAVAVLALSAGCDIGGESETNKLLRRQIGELRKENVALLNSLKAQGKLLEEARLELDRLSKDITALKARPKKKEEEKTGLPLPPGDDEEALEGLLERATRVARQVSPYEGAKLLAKLAQDYPFHEAGMRASAKLREWGVKAKEVNEDRAAEIDATVKKILQKESSLWEALERARQLAGVGRYGEAAKTLNEIVKENPASHQGREARKTLFLWGLEGLSVDGMKDEELAKTVGPAVKAHRLLGQGWHQLEKENLDKAKAIFEMIVEKYPETLISEHARNGLIEIEERAEDRRRGRQRRERDEEEEGEGEEEADEKEDEGAAKGDDAREKGGPGRDEED